MPRRIDTGSAQIGGPKKGLYLGKNGDDYLGRIAGYIPAEIIGLYLATSRAIPAGEPQIASWIVFGINCLFVPLYFIFATARGDKKPLWPQVVLASIAFPVWVFAIGGPFEPLGWYRNWMASITLAFTTVGFGFYKPKPGS